MHDGRRRLNSSCFYLRQKLLEPREESAHFCRERAAAAVDGTFHAGIESVDAESVCDRP